MLVGTFGSFGPLVAPIIAQVLAAPTTAGRRFLLVGDGSHELASKRANATGRLEPPEASAAIAACDVMLQPYPDGISGRRSSAAAALALGVPVVTNAGDLTEDFWATSDAVAIAKSSRSQDLLETLDQIVSNASERARLRSAALDLYDQRFALRHTIARLLAMVGRS